MEKLSVAQKWAPFVVDARNELSPYGLYSNVFTNLAILLAVIRYIPKIPNSPINSHQRHLHFPYPRNGSECGTVWNGI
jgi:hypothetical protein